MFIPKGSNGVVTLLVRAIPQDVRVGIRGAFINGIGFIHSSCFLMTSVKHRSCLIDLNLFVPIFSWALPCWDQYLLLALRRQSSD